eukprot:scaffold179707_cov34-Tisochrysis_lutea.AAC.7
MVEASPVVPRATTPLVPLSTCHRRRERNSSKCMSPFGFIGVMRATSDPGVIGFFAEAMAIGEGSTRRLRPMMEAGWRTGKAWVCESAEEWVWTNGGVSMPPTLPTPIRRISSLPGTEPSKLGDAPPPIVPFPPLPRSPSLSRTLSLLSL